MDRRTYAKVLTDKNQNEFSRQDNYFEDNTCIQVLQEIEIKNGCEDQVKDYELEASSNSACKSKKECENENKNFYISPSERARLRNTKDEFVLFHRQQHLMPAGKDHFSQLSDEIILYIFQMLPKSVLVKCSLVCKRWRELSYDETLWKRHDLGRKVVKRGTLEIILRRGISVLRLAMAEIRDPVFSDGFLRFSGRCSLQYLDLSMAMISPQSLANLLSRCCSLKKLSLEHCTVNEECCNNIAENGQLEVLNMAMCEGVTGNGLKVISLCCKFLKEWNLAWTKLSDSSMEALAQYIPPALLRLNISGNRDTLTDAAVIRIVNRCRNLKELDISDSAQVSGVGFEAIVKCCPNLRHLHTSRSYNIPTESNKLLTGLKHFKCLEIFQTLTDTALASLRDCLTGIKINQHMFSTVARPTVGIRRTSVWEVPTRD